MNEEPAQVLIADKALLVRPQHCRHWHSYRTSAIAMHRDGKGASR